MRLYVPLTMQSQMKACHQSTAGQGDRSAYHSVRSGSVNDSGLCGNGGSVPAGWLGGQVLGCS